MFRKFTKKRIAVLAGVTTLALAAVAFAFFSSTGTGSGSGSVADPATAAITVTGTVTNNLYPGGNSSVTFTAANSESSPVRVHNVHLVSITPDAGHSTCVTTVGGLSPVFSMTDVTEDHVVPANATTESLGTTGTLAMADSGSNQDNCQGATLTLSLTSN